MGRLPSLSRHLLRKLHIDAIRQVVDFYDLPRARSMEEMVDTIVRRVGLDLVRLVSAEGPFALEFWNDTAVELGAKLAAPSRPSERSWRFASTASSWSSTSMSGL